MDKPPPRGNIMGNHPMPMNEQNPETESVEPTPSPLPYKDRSTGLIVFGVLTIAMGGLSGLLVPLMLVGQALAAATTHRRKLSAILPAIFMYGRPGGGVGVAGDWLHPGKTVGQGVVAHLFLELARHGTADMVLMAFVMPKVMANLPSQEQPTIRRMPAAAIVGDWSSCSWCTALFFVILPAIWTFFYNSRHVKATCEWRDPVTSWTDACPLPVLAICLWLLFSALMMLVMPFTRHGVMPFFGMLLTGFPGMLFYLAVAVLVGCAAWLLYRLDQRGWWLILIAMCVWMASGLMTFARHDCSKCIA